MIGREREKERRNERKIERTAHFHCGNLDKFNQWLLISTWSTLTVCCSHVIQNNVIIIFVTGNWLRIIYNTYAVKRDVFMYELRLIWFVLASSSEMGVVVRMACNDVTIIAQQQQKEKKIAISSTFHTRQQHQTQCTFYIVQCTYVSDYVFFSFSLSHRQNDNDPCLIELPFILMWSAHSTRKS